MLKQMIGQVSLVEQDTVKGRFGVDAGNISVTDLSEYTSNGGKFGSTAKRACKVVGMPNGTYNVTVDMPRTWKGAVSQEGTVKVTSGKVAIGDACYFFSSDEVERDVWHKYLDKTSYLKKMEKGFSVDTGGDGDFSATISFKEA